MRVWAFVLVAATGCAGSTDEDELGPCLLDAEPGVRVGRDLGDGFEALADGEELEPFASPQGGFGLLLDMQTRGVGTGPEHEVSVDIVGELDAPGGDPVARYHLDGAPLMCDAQGPGQWGTILLTVDQTRFGTLEDLGVLAGRDIVLRSDVTDQAGNWASGEQTIRIRMPH